MDKKRRPVSGGDSTRREFMHKTALGAAGAVSGIGALGAKELGGFVKETRSYNPEMEYRLLGDSGLWVSAVCLGGHWKRIDKVVPGVFKGGGWLSADLNHEGFKKNRREVVSRCIENGINYIDACTREEVQAYADALKGRRDKMYLGFSWYQEEMRNGRFRTCKALMKTLDKGLRKAGLEYIDLWRITMHEQSSRHSKGEVEEMMKALEKARKQGKTRLTGLSSHDRPHIKWMIENYPEIVQVVVTPYTARTKKLPKDSLFDAVEKYNVGLFGIKPFSSNHLFKGNSVPGNPHAGEDDKRARMTIRYILNNPAVTAPIPGMIHPHQVDNVAQAVKEKRKLNAQESKELNKAMDEAWAKLSPEYQWLKNWEYV